MILFAERRVIGYQYLGKFCWFHFLLELKKCFDLVWYKVYVLCTSYVEKCQSDY